MDDFDKAVRKFTDLFLETIGIEKYIVIPLSELIDKIIALVSKHQ